MGPGDVRAQVDTGNYVAVIQRRTHTIAPGKVGEETIVLTPAVRFGCSALRGTGAISKGALTEQRVTTELGLAVTGTDTTDVVETYLTDQGQTAGTQDTVDEVHSTHGRLPELFTLIATDVIARVEIGQTTVGVILTGSGYGHLTTAETRVSNTGTHQRRTTHVTGSDLDRHVRTIADFTRYRSTTDIGTEADTVQADIFRVLEEVARATKATIITLYRTQQTRGSKRIKRSQISTEARPGNCHRPGHPASHVGVQRVATVVVQGVEAELGVVQRRDKPAECHTELATVSCFIIFLVARYVRIRAGLPLRHIRARVDQPIITPTSNHIRTGKKGPAVISNGAAPFQLVEGFQGQVFGQALGQIQHLDRQQTFLQLSARTAESGGVNRVDGVDAVLDEDTLTPADHLAAETDVTRVLTDEIVVIDEGVQQLDTGTLLQRVTAGVIDIVETLAAILGFEVIPVVATDKGTGIAVAQFQIVGALEDLGEHIAFLVVQTAVVRSTCG